MEKLNIAVLDYNTLKVPLGSINDYGHVSIYDMTTPEELDDKLIGANIVITNKVVLNRESLEKCKDLKLICISATGTNNVDLVAAKELGIAVTNVAGYSTSSVAEHTFALFFEIAKKMQAHNKYGKEQWSSSPIFTNLDNPFREVEKKTWGIIGLGAIGKKVAKVAEAFGCEVIYYSTSGKNSDSDFRRVDLEELLSFSDVVSIHSPLNENTKDLLSYNELSMMKKEAILLNVGRGGIIKESDLSKVLNEGKLGGVGLDVVEVEPPKFTEFFSHEKVVITPHVAWASIEARERLIEEIGQNIKAFLNNEKRNRVE